uniref:Uncharacterized protein n=1 Tax=Helianthus annuus TaxID=4232 RepID=A0A251UP11_HELAN
MPSYLCPSCTVSPYARYAFCIPYSCSKSSWSSERSPWLQRDEMQNSPDTV